MNRPVRLALLVAPVLVLMLLPVVVVIGIAIGESATYEFPPKALSIRWFQSLLSTDIFSDALLKMSLPLAIGVSLISTVLGTAAAIGVSRCPPAIGRALTLLFASPLVFPQILLGVAIFLVYARLNVSLNIASLALAHTLIATPYVVRTVSAALGGLDPRILQAAENLGASPLKSFVLVTLPMLKSSIFSGAIFAFIVSFSDINLALFLTAAGSTTLPMQILAQMQFVSDPTIAAAATVQVLVVSVLIFFAQKLIGHARA